MAEKLRQARKEAGETVVWLELFPASLLLVKDIHFIFSYLFFYEVMGS